VSPLAQAPSPLSIAVWSAHFYRRAVESAQSCWLYNSKLRRSLNRQNSSALKCWAPSRMTGCARKSPLRDRLPLQGGGPSVRTPTAGHPCSRPCRVPNRTSGISDVTSQQPSAVSRHECRTKPREPSAMFRCCRKYGSPDGKHPFHQRQARGFHQLSPGVNLVDISSSKSYLEHAVF
jgi:hypothetical protein